MRFWACVCVCGCGRPGGGSAPTDPPREAPPAHPLACFVITIGSSSQNGAEPPGRGLLGWSLEPTLRSSLDPRS
eukprot:15471508-Alexandrium_andersonii.AAC.1